MIEKGNPLWYKDAVIYQVHVQSFFDSNNDGIGDFKGLTRKLDYIKSLGVTAIWLLPFYPSPLKDGGYDISDYTGINPIYGKLADFKKFLKTAHKLDLRVITELVLNHTSSQHPWFQRAVKAKAGSSKRNFYVWNETPDKYLDARIIFKDFESSNWAWNNEAKAYYWHRFYSHQPDLNFENEEVHEALFEVLDFWFGLGVDGLRLDAIPYLFEKEGTNCENLPETHKFLKKIRAYIDKNHKDKMLLAEANQWTEDAVAYFGDDNECHMAFHFPLMPRLFMSTQMEDRFPIMDILEQTPAIPKNCQWALFLRNHDELTLEMVTDEERDYMYKSFAVDPHQRINLGIRRRLAPLLNNDRRKMELMNMLLFSLPGSPVVYYGDELGMGDNFYLGDRNGVRTPMQWTPDKNAGFSSVNPQKLYLPVIIDPEYHFESINVETQEHNGSSLLWWMRHVIGIRKRHPAFSRGTLEFVYTDNSNILAYTRELDDDVILVVTNLSRYPQVATLELDNYVDFTPKELFSQENFPSLKEDTYQLTLGSYGYLWFSLEKPEELKEEEMLENLLEIKTTLKKWNSFNVELRDELFNKVIQDYALRARWYRGKSYKVRSVDVIDRIPLPNGKLHAHILLLNFRYTNAPDQGYFLPLSLATGDKVYHVKNEFPQSVLCEVDVQGEKGIIYDSIFDEESLQHVFQLMYNKKKIRGQKGEITYLTEGMVKKEIKKSQLPVTVEYLNAEQSNSSVLYHDSYLMKLYRGIDQGINPEVEILKYLSKNKKFKNIAPYAGEITYNNENLDQSISLGILTKFVDNENDAWSYYLSKLDQFFANILSQKDEIVKTPVIEKSILDMTASDIPDEMHRLFGTFTLEMTELLGKRTGEMHVALARSTEQPEFKPESFSLLYQKALYQSVRGQVRKVMPMIKSQLKKLDENIKDDAMQIIENEKLILSTLERIKVDKIPSIKTRIHGDYHLGQVLFTGKDFVIIDFEGEPARPLSERQLKYCPLKDVAGMIRSFHYAVYTVFDKYTRIRPEDMEFLEPWIEIWYKSISWLFLNNYLQEVKDIKIGAADKEGLKTLMQLYMLEKAVYELGYEINNRPNWVVIPIRGINYLLKSFL
jgi:maltose alpha-D-glucosyltransferase/alpha-amylase